MVEFPYRKEKLLRGEDIYRPVAKVYLLREEKEWIAQYFYIDSGADYTLIPYRMGKFLGLGGKSSTFRRMKGIGGEIHIRLASLWMRIGGYTIKCEVAWAEVEEVPFLLGRKGVFEAFDILFKERDKKTIFIWRGR